MDGETVKSFTLRKSVLNISVLYIMRPATVLAAILSNQFLFVFDCPTDIGPRGPVTQNLLSQTLCSSVAQLSGTY